MTGGRIAALVVAAACLAAPGRAWPATPDIAVGLGGEWRVGAWTPVTVSWPADAVGADGRARVAVEDPDGQFVASPPLALDHDANGRATASAAVRFGRSSQRVRIELEQGRDPAVASERVVSGTAVPSATGVAIVFGDLPAAGRALRLVDRERGGTTRLVVAGDAVVPASAPTPFDMADLIILCGSAVPALGDAVVARIDAWVRAGGRLVVLAGESASGFEAAAADWLPGRFERAVPLRRVGAVETFARAGGLAERVFAEQLTIPVFSGPATGVVEAAVVEGASSIPLAVRRARGFGTITWVGCDVDRPPFREWAGTESLVFAALERRAGQGGEPTPGSGPRGGDLASQLRAALDTFAAPGASRPPRVPSFELLAGLGLLYVLALYPLDWWLASRSAARSWLAWVTLPAIATAFAAAAFWLTPTRGLRGLAACTTAEVVDIDAVTSTARGSAWAAALSADNDRLDVSVEASGALVPAAEAAVSWFADAGAGFGGMDAAIAHPSLATADYAYADTRAALRAVPVAAGASRLFEAEWTGTVAADLVDARLTATTQRTLAGTIAHRLPFPLERCRLLHAGWLYDVGTLRAGDAYDCAAGRGPRSLASALTRRAAVKERDATPRWDAAGTDVARILEVAGFHASAGGPAYTGLAAGRLGRLDLSPLLAVDRAVLVGEVAAPGQVTSWRIAARGGAAEPRPAAPTLVRIVVPVSAESAP
jgi:hypothetical protein